MPRRADILLGQAGVVPHTAQGVNYLVQTTAGVFYQFQMQLNGDVRYKKSSDGGLTWGPEVDVSGAVTVISLAVWYDRWSNIAADLIHIAYTETAASDTFYRTLDTSSDTLSTITTIFAGTSAVAAGSHLTIARAKGGNVYCRTTIDAGAEGGFFRLPNANVPNGAWDAARTIDETLATSDVMILQPDFDAADTQDMLAIFWDNSANEISRKLYDDSANSWAETSIATSMTKGAQATAFPHFAAAPDISNTRSYLIAWSNVDTSTARLRAWTVDSGAITALTDVVSSSTDDQGLCALALHTATGHLWAFYGGKTDGSETYQTALQIYYKISKDAGSTWGPETLLSQRGVTSLRWMAAAPRTYIGEPALLWFDDQSVDEWMVNVPVPMRGASYVLGIS